MKYVVLRSGDKETDRKITVINGQPYYQSTGYNSGMTGRWLPFYGLRGDKEQLNIQPHIQDRKLTLNRDATISMFNGASKGVLLKDGVIGLTPTVDEALWCTQSLAIKRKIDSKVNEPGQSQDPADQIFDRLYLKTDFINSCRLQGAKDKNDEELFKKAGLDDNQKKEAANTIQLDEKAEFITDDPDRINQWLIQQGVKFEKYPASYQELWKNTYKENKDARNVELKQVRALLSNYVRGNALGRFFTLHWNRHHTDVVSKALENKDLNTPNKLIAYIRYGVGEKLDQNGSLARRLDFIEKQIFTDEKKRKEAHQLHWQWQRDNKLPVAHQTYVRYAEYMSPYDEDKKRNAQEFSALVDIIQDEKYWEKNTDNNEALSIMRQSIQDTQAEKKQDNEFLYAFLKTIARTYYRHDDRNKDRLQKLCLILATYEISELSSCQEFKELKQDRENYRSRPSPS
jgi:hypothetical protein